MIPTSYKIDGPDSAPPLVLLNSLGSTMDMWRYQLPFLTQRFKVIRVDTRGHTRDTKPPSGPYSIQELGSDIVDLIKHLDLNMVSLCGLSLGGMIAMNIAANQPNLVD
ncbi:3-oxoadipate enol-lactone hydrolase, partial [mine drainage metagenome]